MAISVAAVISYLGAMLKKAAKNGDVATLQAELRQENARVNRSESTALILVASDDYIHAVKFFIEDNAQLDFHADPNVTV